MMESQSVINSKILQYNKVAMTVQLSGYRGIGVDAGVAGVFRECILMYPQALIAKKYAPVIK